MGEDAFYQASRPFTLGAGKPANTEAAVSIPRVFAQNDGQKQGQDQGQEQGHAGVKMSNVTGCRPIKPF